METTVCGQDIQEQWDIQICYRCGAKYSRDNYHFLTRTHLSGLGRDTVLRAGQKSVVLGVRLAEFRECTHSGIQGLFQVLDDVLLVLQPHGQTDHCVTDPQGGPITLRNRRMGHYRPERGGKKRVINSSIFKENPRLKVQQKKSLFLIKDKLCRGVYNVPQLAEYL